MFKFLFRVVLFFMGVFLIVDSGLPTTKQTLHVDGHNSHLTHTKSINGQPAAAAVNTSYEIRFDSPTVSSCSVGYSAFNNLEDGDTVLVETTKILKSCVRIERGNEVILQSPYRKIGALLFGLFMMVIAIWWPDNETNVSISL